MPKDKNEPLRLVFSVTAETSDFDVKLAKSKRRPIVQIAMNGAILSTGVEFTSMEAATDEGAPAEMFEVIENLFPMIGQALQDVRTGKRTPSTKEQRYYSTITGERVPPAKLDS